MPAKYNVLITPTAEGDIAAIWDYIAEDSPANALHFIGRLEKEIGTLQRHPERCPLIPENEVLGSSYRHLVIDSYRIVFSIVCSTAFILRVIHGARLLDTSVFEL